MAHNPPRKNDRHLAQLLNSPTFGSAVCDLNPKLDATIWGEKCFIVATVESTLGLKIRTDTNLLSLGQNLTLLRFANQKSEHNKGCCNHIRRRVSSST